MSMFNIPQTLLWIGNYQLQGFDPDKLEKQLVLLAAPVNFEGSPRAPSLFAVLRAFQKGARLPSAKNRHDITKSLATAIADPATAILQGAQNELLRNLLAGNIVMHGREVRQPEVIFLKNGTWSRIEHPPGPSIPIEAIPAASFAELRFIDQEGVEVAPKEYPTREFPRWRDLLPSEEDVRRLWPIERPIERPITSGKKRGRKPEQFERVATQMRKWSRDYLERATEIALEVELKASRDTCRRARNAVLSENN
jgi:hypothetical protein